MKSLLWKEFHENLKWGALGLLLMSGYMGNYGACLCDSFFGVVSFLAALIGGVLGILQMTFESHGDRRALLLHRPIRRTNIFLAKIVAGASLYLLALGLPLLFYLVTAFIPGRVAPQLPLSHRWPLIFPWLADLLTGLVYYLAGALAGLRPGRWYGSRALGFPAALLASFLAWNLAEFWEVLVALFVLSSVMGLAAWGSFLTAGDTDSQPLLAKCGLACTFFLGLSVLSLEGKSIFEYRVFRSAADHDHAHYQINRDGQVLVVEPLGENRVRVCDLAGRELEEFRSKTPREAHVELEKQRADSVAAHSDAWDQSQKNYRAISRYLVQMANQPIPPGEGWCFVPSLGELVGYDYVSGNRIGSLGPQGFAADDGTPRSRFQGSLDYSFTRANLEYLAFPTGVYTVDIERRNVQRLFTPAAGEVVHGARNFRDPRQVTPLERDDKSISGIETFKRSDSDNREQVVVGTNRAIYVLAPVGNKEFVFRAVYDTRQYTMFLNRLENPQRYAVYYFPSYFLGLIPRETMVSYVVEYSTDGQELSRTTLPANPWQKILRQQPWFGALTSPGEGALLLKSMAGMLFKTEPDRKPFKSKFQHSVLERYHRILPYSLDLPDGLRTPRVQIYVLGMAFNAVLGAVGCLWLSRRLAIAGNHRVAWIACGLLFGMVAALLMACVREWPARVACPRCGQLRLVTRDLCEHCGAPHSAPVRDGTEVLPVAAA